MIAPTDYRAFRLINGFAGAAGWLDVTMVLLAEYAPLLFVGALLWLWLRRGSEPGKFQDRLAVGRALAAAALALGLGQSGADPADRLPRRGGLDIHELRSDIALAGGAT